MRRVFCWVALIAAAGCTPTDDGPGPDLPPPPPPSWTADMQAVADGNNWFALDLYGQLRAEPGNLFFSPYSAHTALSMTAAGAKGNTRDEMVKVLHLPADPDKALAAGDLGRFYSGGTRPYELAVANALWGQAGYPWRKEFLDRQQARFGAGLNPVDFVGDKSGAVRRINQWVGEQTRGRITDILRPEDVPVYERAQVTRMVLTNAIYFKGRWAEQFRPGMNQDAPFHKAGGGDVRVPLMHRTDDYRYADPDGLQVLELPYLGGDLSMVVVLPRKSDGLPELEKRLTADALTGWLGKLGPARVSVYLPRFKLKQRFDMNKPLGALGMAAPFDPVKADFDGMADLRAAGEPLFISKVVHEAFVDVNEEGTEAAAATAVVVATPVSAPPPPVEFRADRPFLFLIRDVKHGTILFLGRVTDPTK